MESRDRLQAGRKCCYRAQPGNPPAVGMAADELKTAAPYSVSVYQEILCSQERVEGQPGDLEPLDPLNERNVIDTDDSGIECFVAHRIRIEDDRFGAVEKDRPHQRCFVMFRFAVE